MNDYYKEKRISNSSLKWFEQSPLYFKKLLYEEIEKETMPWAESGSQIHMFILEPEKFEEEFIFLDYETPVTSQQRDFLTALLHSKKGTKDEKLVKAYTQAYSTKNKSEDKILEEAKALEKKYKDYLTSLRKTLFDKKTVLKENSRELLENCKLSVLEHKLAKELLFNEDHKLFGDTDKFFAKNEFHINWEHEPTKLECKSLLDRLIINHENKRIILVDIKTCNSFENFTERISNLKYDRQVAYYWHAIVWYLFNELKWSYEQFNEYNKESYIIAIKTKELVETKVFEVPGNLLYKADKEIENIMSELKWHFDNDKWDYTRQYYEGNGLDKLI